MKHPHADERRPRSMADQLDGTMFAPAPAPGPTTRVGRRTLTQDVAHMAAKVKAPTKRQRILDWLKERRGRGFTREQIADQMQPKMKLQTVCGRVNELLNWTVGDDPVPLVYESGIMNGSNLVFAHDNAFSHHA